MTHPQIPQTANERDTLVAFLDYYRELMLDKAGGLSKEQLGVRLEPSTMTLAGMIYHLAVVEQGWFSNHFLGLDLTEPWASVDWEADRDWEWDIAPTLEPEVVLSAYRTAFERSNEIIAAADSLDQLSVKDEPGSEMSLRWILVHMVEETARHAGHADLIRESIDGEVGDFRKS
ncbi:MAG: DinB family protein [Actinomycetia bacterium]|nr:DinB family protein [Actinomycetes bacterium]